MTFKTLCCCVIAALIFSATQTAQAQSFSQLTTRRGAVAGAIIGGIAGNQNNETLAGVAIGGLVGGVTGRIIGNQAQNFYGGRVYQQPRPVYYSQPRYYSAPTYVPARSYSPNYYVPRRSCGGF